MALGRVGKPETSQYFLRALRWAISTFGEHSPDCSSFFVIPEHLALIRSVVFAFTVNKQTNKQTSTQLYILAEVDHLQ